MGILSIAKRIGAGIILMVLAATANASLIVTLTHDGSDGVLASFNGSGQTTGDDNNTNLWFSDELGGFTSATNLNLALNPSVAFNNALNIVALDILTSQNGIFSMQLDGTTGGPGTSFDILGDAVVNGLAFSTLNVGTYTPGAGGTNEIGDFTLIIQDAQIPEPNTLALLILGIAGIYRRRQLEAA